MGWDAHREQTPGFVVIIDAHSHIFSLTEDAGSPGGKPRAWPPLGRRDQEQLYGMYWSVAMAAASGVDVIRSLVFIQSP